MNDEHNYENEYTADEAELSANAQSAAENPEVNGNTADTEESVSEAVTPPAVEEPDFQVDIPASEQYSEAPEAVYTEPQPEPVFEQKSEPVQPEAAPVPPSYNPYSNGYDPEAQQELMRNRMNQNQGYNPYAPSGNQSAAGQYNSQSYQYNPQASYGNNVPGGMPQKGKNNGMKVAIGVIVACVIVAVLVIFMTAGSNGKKDQPATNAESTSQAVQNNTQAATDNNVAIVTTKPDASAKDAIWVAEKVRPSVVGVMVYKNGQLAGEGSGVLMSEKDGYTYVVTCAHVVEASGVTYSIMLLDGKTYEAELVASDTRTDIAVVKVKQTGLPVAEFGDSKSLKVGETIYAIGNPGGSEYFGSMTDGIVSAIDRSINATYTMTCIQHNAAINPGNSGGALVNSQGQVVGINSSKIASTEYEGMGFAVPTAIAKPVVDALIQHGYVPNRPKLGIEYAPVSSYQLYSMVVSIKGLPKGSLVIAGISEDSSLVNSQAQVGDLIIGVNGKDMDDSSVLLDLIDTGAVGDTITLKLCRIENRTYKTTTFDVTITLIEDKGKKEEEQTTEPEAFDGYYYGGADSFEDFFNDYFGEFGW